MSEREARPAPQSSADGELRAPRPEGPMAMLTERFGPHAARALQRRIAQRKAAQPSAGALQAAADAGIRGGSGAMPHLGAIQQSFGKHDVSQIQAHTDGAAAQGAAAMGAEAFATGNHVAFAGAPDLHTAAHEAAHVVQQRAGVQLKGGIGEEGDAYEQHADAVADKVVRGESAEALLDQHAGAPAATAIAAGGVQRKVRHPKESRDLQAADLDAFMALVGADPHRIPNDARRRQLALELLQRGGDAMTFEEAVKQLDQIVVFHGDPAVALMGEDGGGGGGGSVVFHSAPKAQPSSGARGPTTAPVSSSGPTSSSPTSSLSSLPPSSGPTLSPSSGPMSASSSSSSSSGPDPWSPSVFAERVVRVVERFHGGGAFLQPEEVAALQSAASEIYPRDAAQLKAVVAKTKGGIDGRTGTDDLVHLLDSILGSGGCGESYVYDMGLFAKRLAPGSAGRIEAAFKRGEQLDKQRDDERVKLRMEKEKAELTEPRVTYDQVLAEADINLANEYLVRLITANESRPVPIVMRTWKARRAELAGLFETQIKEGQILVDWEDARRGKKPKKQAN